MCEKSRLLYELMLRKGYPEEFSRLICSFLMIIGRLELYTIIVLFSRHYWNPDRG